jgi:cytidyltransferase-like protein
LKNVFVSGCFDLLHSGHVEFLREAAVHGDVYAGIGSDKTVYDLKGRLPVNNEQERLFMVRSIRYVKDAWINSGSGIMDFIPEINFFRPDLIFVNEDGHSTEKEEFCKNNNIEYLIRKRTPPPGLPSRSTTVLRTECRIPYRIDLAGGWLDQPYVSKFYPGPVITISIEPDYEFNDRSGMATSTRRKAIDLWQAAIPAGDPEQLSKILFAFENPPGTKYVSGSQDPIGIVFPGLNRLYYNKEEYWPSEIETIHDDDVLNWLEERISLLSIHPRESGFHVLDKTNIIHEDAKMLAEAAEELWTASTAKNDSGFGNAMKKGFSAQVSMFPLMINEQVREAIRSVEDKCFGYKLSGAGGGGYLVIFGDQRIEGSLKIRIRREL